MPAEGRPWPSDDDDDDDDDELMMVVMTNDHVWVFLLPQVANTLPLLDLKEFHEILKY